MMIMCLVLIMILLERWARDSSLPRVWCLTRQTTETDVTRKQEGFRWSLVFMWTSTEGHSSHHHRAVSFPVVPFDLIMTESPLSFKKLKKHNLALELCSNFHCCTFCQLTNLKTEICQSKTLDQKQLSTLPHESLWKFPNFAFWLCIGKAHHIAHIQLWVDFFVKNKFNIDNC